MSKDKPTVNNGNSTVRWITLIVSIFLGLGVAAYGATQIRLAKHDDLIMSIREDVIEIKTDVKYIRQQLEK